MSRVQTPFAVIDDNAVGSDAEICECTETFQEAVKAWQQLFEAETTKTFSVTGWNHGVLASHRDIRDLFAKAAGTFRCPICAVGEPHAHDQTEVAEHRKFVVETQSRNEERRREILSRADHVVSLYALPRRMRAEDIGLTTAK